MLDVVTERGALVGVEIAQHVAESALIRNWMVCRIDRGAMPFPILEWTVDAK